VALIKAVATPYWLHLHRRIDQEMPEIELHCLSLYDVADQPWSLKGQDIRPMCFGEPGEYDTDRPLRTLRHDWDKGGRIIEWLREHNARAAVIGGYHNITAPRVFAWCHAHRIPCFIMGDSNIHADRTTGLRRVVKNLVVRWVLSKTSGVMPHGTAGRNFYLKYGADPKKIYYFPGEPDYRLIEDMPASEVEAARVTHGFAPGRRRLVYCGRLVGVKRVDLLMSAFVAIADQRPEWDLVILGDGPLKQQLASQIPESLKNRVSWTGFLGDQRKIAGVYRNCDVLVLPSDHEPWAIVVNEAVAAGLAVVTSNVVGAADDLVRPGVNGLTFPRGDAVALTACLLEVTDPTKTDGFKSASASVLAEWRKRGDPVNGLRQALQATGVLPPTVNHEPGMRGSPLAPA